VEQNIVDAAGLFHVKSEPRTLPSFPLTRSSSSFNFRHRSPANLPHAQSKMRIPEIFYVLVFIGGCIATSSNGSAQVETTDQITADAVVNENNATGNYGVNRPDDPLASGFSILFALADPTSYAGEQVVPGTGSLTLTYEDPVNPGVGRAEVFVANVVLTATSSPDYDQFSATELDLGAASYTVTSGSNGDIGQLTGTSWDTALDDVYNGKYDVVAIAYPGFDTDYVYGDGVSAPLAPLIQAVNEAVPAGVPEPSTWALLGVGVIGLLVVRFGMPKATEITSIVLPTPEM
jgi:hypothetical protein